MENDSLLNFKALFKSWINAYRKVNFWGFVTYISSVKWYKLLIFLQNSHSLLILQNIELWRKVIVFGWEIKILRFWAKFNKILLKPLLTILSLVPFFSLIQTCIIFKFLWKQVNVAILDLHLIQDFKISCFIFLRVDESRSSKLLYMLLRKPA